MYIAGFLIRHSQVVAGSLTRLGSILFGGATAKFEAEKVAEEEAKKEFSKQEKASKKLQGGLRNLAEVRHLALALLALAPSSTALTALSDDCSIHLSHAPPLFVSPGLRPGGH